MSILNPIEDFTAPKVHTSGRRELRNQILSRGITMTARPRNQADAERIKAGELVPTLPIKRATPKIKGKKKKRHNSLSSAPPISPQ